MMEFSLLWAQWDQTGYAYFQLFAHFFLVYLARFALLHFFAGRVLQKRKKAYKFFLVNIFTLIQAAAEAYLLQKWDDGIWFLIIDLFGTAVFALSLHLLYSDSFAKKAAYTMLAQFVMIFADILNGMIYYSIDEGVYFNFYNSLRQMRADYSGFYRIIYCTGLKVGELVLLLILSRLLIRIFTAGEKKEIGALNYFAVIIFVISRLISLIFWDYPSRLEYYILPPAMVVISAAAIAGIFVFLRFFPRMCRRFFFANDNRPVSGGDILERQTALHGDFTRQLQKLRHDVKNNVATITALIDTEPAEAKRLLGELGERLCEALGSSNKTGNAAIDTTVSAKSALCLERGITLDLHVEPIPETKISSLDLTSALANILDNAIDAAADCKDAVITLRVFKYKMYLAVICENPTSSQPRFVDGRLVTSKDGGQHGFGTEIVTEICKRNNGRFQIEFTDKTFKASAFMEL